MFVLFSGPFMRPDLADLNMKTFRQCLGHISISPSRSFVRSFDRKVHYASCYLISQTIDQISRKLPIIRPIQTSGGHTQSPTVVTRSFETKFGWPMTIANVFFERFFPRLSDTTRHTTRKTEWIMNRKTKMLLHLCPRASPVLRRYSIDCVKSVLGKHK